MGCSYSMLRFSIKNDQATYSHIQKGQFLQCEKQIQEKVRTGQYSQNNVKNIIRNYTINSLPKNTYSIGNLVYKYAYVI